MHNATVQRHSFAGIDCSVAQALELVGEWWTLLLIREAFLGRTRFEQFQQRLGIARNILSRRLETLVDAEILERRLYSQHPQRHEYRLTQKGRDLFPVITALRQWGDKWTGEGDPPLTLRHLDCGHEAWVVQKCAHCGGEVTPRNVRAEGRLLGNTPDSSGN